MTSLLLVMIFNSAQKFIFKVVSDVLPLISMHINLDKIELKVGIGLVCTLGPMHWSLNWR